MRNQEKKPRQHVTT